MVVDPGQSQRGPGELQGLEVDRGASGSLAFYGRLVPGSRPAGGTVENAHRVEREAVQDLDAAVMEGQSEA